MIPWNGFRGVERGELIKTLVLIMIETLILSVGHDGVKFKLPPPQLALLECFRYQ